MFFDRYQKIIYEVLDSSENYGDQNNWEMRKEGSVSKFMDINFVTLYYQAYAFKKEGLFIIFWKKMV